VAGPQGAARIFGALSVPSLARQSPIRTLNTSLLLPPVAVGRGVVGSEVGMGAAVVAAAGAAPCCFCEVLAVLRETR
jgi:hypothetical protein